MTNINLTKNFIFIKQILRSAIIIRTFQTLPKSLNLFMIHNKFDYSIGFFQSLWGFHYLIKKEIIYFAVGANIFFLPFFIAMDLC